MALGFRMMRDFCFDGWHNFQQPAPGGNAQESQAAAEAHAACPCRGDEYGICDVGCACSKMPEHPQVPLIDCRWPGHRAIDIALLEARLEQAELCESLGHDRQGAYVERHRLINEVERLRTALQRARGKGGK